MSNVGEPQPVRGYVLAIKGDVSFRFSQGLLNLICNNLKLKADINFFFFCVASVA